MGRTVVVGGGVAGLTVAYRLARGGREVLCLEAQATTGGVVQTRRVNGYLCEVGPQNFLESEGGPVSRLAAELGLGSELAASTDAQAYLHHAGTTRPLPRDLPRLLSWRGLFRGLFEAFVRREEETADATVLAWGTRRFGREVAELLLDPAAVGMSLGDPAALSARSTLPALVELERRHGSVLRGAVRSRAPRRRAQSFREGMGTLTEALAARLGAAVETGVVVDAIERGPGGFEIAAIGKNGARVAIPAGDVVVATPAPAAAAFVEPLSRPLAELLRAIPFAPVVTCALAFRACDFAPAPPRGYGVMVPTGGGPRVRGCLFSTWSTRMRACPDGEILLRSLFGGRLDPGVGALSDDEIEALCAGDLQRLVGLRRGARATLRRVERIVPGFPQYEVGHDERVARIQAHAQKLGGLRLVGSSYQGIPVSQVVARAEELAASLLERPQP